MLPLRRFIDVECARSVVGMLHVDFDRPAKSRSGCGDLLSERQAEVEIEIEAELRQLDGNVAVEPRIVKLAEHVDVRFACSPSVLRRSHVFAQQVQNDSPARATEFGGGLQGLVQGFAGNEPAGETVAHAIAGNRVRHSFLRRKPKEKISQEHGYEALTIAGVAHTRMQCRPGNMVTVSYSIAQA